MYRLIGIALAVGAVAFAVAFFIPWLPDSASKERERIDFVFWLTTVICIAIFMVVAGISIYAGVKFRARPDDDSDGPPVHGHTGLEIVWTAIPAVLVTVIAVASGVVLAKNDKLPARHLVVHVSGRQFAWSFEYPGKVKSGTLRLPLDQTVELRIESEDVIHSFWVPEFGQKQDALPDQENKLVVTPTEVGRYPVICTELCGLGHAVMRSYAEVLPRAKFRAWLAAERTKLPAGAAS